MIGSRVKRKPICATFPTTPMTAATITKMKECLQMRITAILDASLTSPTPFNSMAPERKRRRFSASSMSATPVQARSANSTTRMAVEVMSFDEHTCPFCRASRSFLGVGISVFSPALSAMA